MTDGVLAAIWLAILGGGIGLVVALARAGLPRTWARDLLHVGAGVWVLSWPSWRAPLAPIAITAAAALGAPFLALVRTVREAVSGADERWTGIALYALAFAIFTIAAFTLAPFPAAGALLALSLGDGIGGFVGRRFGRTRYRMPGAKTKSFEGSAAVALGAAAGISLAAFWLAAETSPAVVAVAALAAAMAEAAAPRSSDNLLVPAAVWGVLTWMP